MDYEKHRDYEEWHRPSINVTAPHFHRALEFFYCISGESDYCVGEESGVLTEGDLIIVSPMLTHSYKVNGESWCDVLPIEYTDEWEHFANGKSPAYALIKNGELTKDIRAHLSLIKSNVNPVLKRGIYNYVLGRIFTEVPFVESHRSKANDFTTQVLTYIDQHFNEDLTLEELSVEFGYSKYYFSNLFNKYFNTNLKSYINQVRIAKAVKLLKKYSISEVSGMCGYNSQQAFFYNFKKITGKSPMAIITNQDKK